ncbi:MAG: isoleucine--tRNA ligase [Methanocellales archaeon]
MVKEIIAHYDAIQVEKEVMQFWLDNDVYKKVRELRSSGQRFFFVDGPPYTTGRIHLGTAWNKILKDAILRYKSMKGFNLFDRAGWDMHGLPIEVKVEAYLGFKSKKEIEQFGIDKFVSECKRFALEHMKTMTQQFQRLGSWLNWENPYMTIKNEYIEAAWWTLKKAWEQGLLEQGKRVVNWCPRCETAIADSEVEYWDEEDPSIYVKFPVIGEENTYLVIWTTTPWTIPANLAVAAHPSFEYVKVRVIKNGKEEKLILASAQAEAVLRKGNYEHFEIVERMLGEDLAKLNYEHPLKKQVPKQEFIHRVYLADFVTAENTGLVHIAPGHGLEDFYLGLEKGLPIFCPVDSAGCFTEEAGEYRYKYTREANSDIISDLEKQGYLLSNEKILHRYGHCWRCKTPIIYLATEQWFIKVSELKQKMLEEVDKITWYPDWAGYARFKDWISGVRDWCISRQRYWGIPLPIWKCESCKAIEVIGTIQELEEKAGVTCGDLHRPYVDEIELPCKCGSKMKRVSDVFDVWFDSAVASWAALNFPRDTQQFEKWWPADFITEGHDQTRGWFYSQLGASLVAFGKAPYKSVLMHGFTLDEQGRKMSKSLGNVVAPEDVIEKFGADTLRFYVLSSNAPWEDLRFNWEEVMNANRFLNIFWNVHRFPLPYMELDKFDPAKVKYADVEQYLRYEDKWILSRLQSLIKEVTTSIEGYQIHKATRLLSEFILEDLSRWYVQLIRPRTWVEREDLDKLAAYYTIYNVLKTVVKLIAPFTPFIAEKIYRNLVITSDPNSVHMCDYPIADETLIDRELELDMRIAREIVEASLNARQKSKRKLRWPVRRIIISPRDERVVKAAKKLARVIQDQANSKEIIVLNLNENWREIGLEVVPNPSAIGPKFKAKAAVVMNALRNLNGFKLKDKPSFELEIDGESFTITQDMVSYREKIPENLAAADFTLGRVYVDITLDEDLEAEGYSREILRRIQDMRRELKLEIEELVDVSIEIDVNRIKGYIEKWRDYIKHETRARNLEFTQAKGFVKEWIIEDVNLKIGLERLK